eukprot:13303466-Alexandrium_andersonii.AAC.1
MQAHRNGRRSAPRRIAASLPGSRPLRGGVRPWPRSPRRPRRVPRLAPACSSPRRRPPATAPS